MSGYITPISPSSVIGTHVPRKEGKKDVSQWFVNEIIELDFGDSVGRPSENILLQREYITRFLENGWTIDAVLSTENGGTWKSTGKSNSESYTGTCSESDTGTDSKNGPKGSNISSSCTDSREISKSETENEQAFWYVKQRVRLRRRRMQPERVMQAITDSFTDAYNSGREIDNERFNEVVSMYALLLKRNEDEANVMLERVINRTNPTYFLDKLYSSTWGSLNAAHNSAANSSRLVEKDATADVNRQFDALLAKSKAQMITAGTYNGTVWPSVAAGIERQRAAALAKAKSEASQVGASAMTSVASAKASAASAFLDAQLAIQKAIDNRRVSASEMRNTVVKWILDFIGNREEVYPELQEISSVAERLGFSVGSAGNVL